MITPGNEYLNGGPTKQHNTSHATDKGPIILKLLYSHHYGSRGAFVSGQWLKVFGPVFVYLNKADDGQALWKNAKREHERHCAAWPYAWLKHSEYAVQRAQVCGRFVGTEPARLDEGCVVLARPREQRGLDWQQQGAEDYIYRAGIDTDGSFRIPAVRKGSYTLYALATDMVGEFRQGNISVDTAGELNLGELQWQARSFGNLLWRIGRPDRSAAEFRHGDDYRHWGLWFNYASEYPADVDFTINESRERRDWNYAHMAVWEEEGGWKPRIQPADKTGSGNWRLPTWKIRFRCDKPMRGQATLTLALASVSGDGGLAIGLNGKPLDRITGMKNDSALPRSGIRGFFREHFIAFDAARLHEGENVMTLELLPRMQLRGKRLNYPHFGIMYDFVQLEVDEIDLAKPF
jgi:rhamnogalacturonan endolyase